MILNPDAAPMPGWGDAIRRPWEEERGWVAWQALVADHGGERINSAGNPVHFTGIVWAGGHGRPISEAPPAGEVTYLSGACLAIPRAIWEAAGGFAERFFLYHEDVDLSPATATGRRRARDRAGCGRRPRVRVRRPSSTSGAGSSAIAGRS